MFHINGIPILNNKTMKAINSHIRENISGSIAIGAFFLSFFIIKIIIDTNTVITEKMHDTCLAEYNTCINDKTKSGEILSDAKLQELYNSCLAEENIQVYDADGIIGMGSKDEERCNDGIDNDLNGFIDAADPACKNTASPNDALNNSVSAGGDCVSGTTNYTNGRDPNQAQETTPCESPSINTCRGRNAWKRSRRT